MSLLASTKICPGCGAELTANAPQGLCPKCLLLGVAAPTEAGERAGTRPSSPPLAVVQAAFPQLEIVELIGQGGMGAVYRARQSKLNRLVALKILPEALARDPAFAERFAREGQTLARLHHPNIVTVHDFGQANGFFYLLMEYVDGVNLRQAMQAGRFTPEQALAIVPMICEALQYAHDEGVLHRDIKPENILLDTKGRVRLVDFGIAKLAASADQVSGAAASTASLEAELTQAGSALGTPNYMAPEQKVSPSTVDQRADIYSLGVVFYEMLTGELPTGRFAPPSRKTPLDPRVDDVVMRALAKQKEKRFQSAEEVKTRVEALTASEPRKPPVALEIPQAAQCFPIPLGPQLRIVLLVGLFILIGLMLDQILVGFRLTLVNFWRTMEAGWIQGFASLVGIAGISWLGFWLWQRREWLMPIFKLAGPLPGTTDSGTPSRHPGSEDRWLTMAWTGLLAALVVEIVWILLGHTVMVAQWVSVRHFLLILYSMLPDLLFILLMVLLVGREVRRTKVVTPSVPPSWMPRAALLAILFGVLGNLRLGSPDLPTVYVGSGGFIAIMALALLTRSRIWRAIALACLIQSSAIGLMGLVNVLLAINAGQLPAEWSVNLGVISTSTLWIIMQCVSLFCCAAGLVALLLPGTRAAFGLSAAKSVLV